jgi:hypothetical protein
VLARGERRMHADYAPTTCPVCDLPKA